MLFTQSKYNSPIFIVIILLTICMPCCIKDQVPTLDPGFTGQKGEMTDKEGNTYKTIGIGTQIWMAENLRSTKLNDSTAILIITDSLEWINANEPALCWFNNDTSMNIPYGILYNYHAVNSGKLCPTGWHIPTDLEWSILIERLGGSNVAGGKLKVIGTEYWNKPNTVATNSSMFNAVPSGVNWSGTFSGFGRYCNWWSINKAEFEHIWTPSVWYNRAVILNDAPIKKSSGISVRCLKN
jgi:uncharacterized protein (TIGR02145 family)